MNVIELLQKAVVDQASDIFIIAGLPVSYRANGRILREQGERLMPPQTSEFVQQLYELAQARDLSPLLERGDDDFSFAIPGLSRFRVSAYKQRGALSAVIRVITFELPRPEDIGIPAPVMKFAGLSKGMVLVTGPAGSGKSTTLACLVNQINHTMEKHIITLEDPIEYLHRHDKSIVSQREISIDTLSYVNALRASLRQSPDVILLGEMRDYETMDVAMTAAETGHLVISTLHTVGAANTIDRIIDSFPPAQQEQVRAQLSMVMQAVVSQQLIPKVEGGVVPAFEVMFFNNAIRNLIRESKIHQIDNIIATSQEEGMITMDNSLIKLFKDGKISRENAVIYSSNGELMEKKLARL